ncbi:hypothetical protein Misp01_79490 [Microtetraspora sp. NBRC 13810]|nr:hypothetical protein Misp01_79490 [Microtetraspora sp. NBRC 13810]
MIYACRLLEQSAGDEQSALQSELLDGWYSSVALNGLCGGWVTIHRAQPVWIENLWGCLERWQPTGTCKWSGDRADVKAADLGTLQTLLKAAGFDGDGHEIRHAVRALTAAWEIMDGLEPDASYGKAPDWLKKKAGALDTAAALKLVKVYEHELDMDSANSAAWFTDTIFDKTGFLGDEKDAHYIAHFETKSHHMSVRLHRHQKVSTITVMESEVAGVVKCTTKDDVLAVLKGGCAVGYETAGDSESTSDSDPEYSIKIYSVS